MKKTRILFLLLLVTMLVMGGCAKQTATSTPAPAEPTSTSAPAASEETSAASSVTQSLTISGKELSAIELDKLEKIEIEVEGEKFTGIRILDLLEAAGASGAETISLVASDGYAGEVAVADLDDQSILALDADGTLDAVVPGQGKGCWVKDTVEITAVAGGASEAEEAVLTVAGKAFSAADLDKLDRVDIEVEGTKFTGIGILDLLEAAGASGAETISLVASDGYAGEVAVADLDDQSILALDADGTLDAVVPGQGKGCWVRDTVEITAALPAMEDAILSVAGKSYNMDMLKTFDQVEITVEGTNYTGIRITDLLADAGVAGEGSLHLIASDGYEGMAPIDMLTDESILAYNDEGGVNTVLPDMDLGSWVKYVVEIKVVEAQAPSEPLPTRAPAASGESVTVVDSIGVEVQIPDQVQAVASMRSGITEIICALGQKDKIIAVDEMVKLGIGYGKFIAGVHPDLMRAHAPFAGRDISVEEMLRINPDLVLHGGYGRIKQAEALKKQAPDLPVVIAHFETIENYMNDVRIVAQCVDAEERAEALISYLQGTLDFVQSRVKDVPEGEKVRVFYGGHDIYHVYTPETFEHAQITMAGGVNVASELVGWLPEVSPEQMLVWDPEVIIVLNGVDVNAILSDPKVASVSAIKNKRVYSLPEASWDFSSPRALFCIEWLASKLYPERFSNVDIEAEADMFYQNVFGVDYTGPALADATADAALASSKTRMITDMRGRHVEVPAEPQRVVSVFPYITYASLALGGEDILAAVDSPSTANANLARIYPGVADMPGVGMFFSPNTESVLLADPDLLLTVMWAPDPDELQNTLEVPVVCVDMNLYKESIEFIARVLGSAATENGQEFIAYYEGKMDSISDGLAGVAEADRAKVYVAGGEGMLSTFGKESTWHYEIADAGGINVGADLIGGGSHEVSMEQVVAWNPDVIVLDNSCTDSVDDLMNDDRWQTISAVQTGRVYRAPVGFLDTFGRPHLESALARIWLADKLYPELLGLDITAEAGEFYSRLYGIDLPEAEIDGILNPE